jgi:hypothetical protein
MAYSGTGRPSSTQTTVLPAYRRGNQLVVICPHCRREHYHGADGGDGHRLGHCADDRSPYRRSGYVLQEVVGVVLWVTG